MSEFFSRNHEHDAPFGQIDQQTLPQPEATPLPEVEQPIDTATAIKQAELHARPASETLALHAEDNSRAEPEHYGLKQRLKTGAYQHTLTQARHSLSAPSRVLSRIIHQPTIEAVTNAAASTAGRPSGLLGGALGALGGSAWALYAAKHFGYTYNYGLFLLLFVGGFFAGLTIEFAARLLHRK